MLWPSKRALADRAFSLASPCRALRYVMVLVAAAASAVVFRRLFGLRAGHGFYVTINLPASQHATTTAHPLICSEDETRSDLLPCPTSLFSGDMASHGRFSVKKQQREVWHGT